MQIEGGTGNGYKAKVTEENMLLTRAVTVSDEHHVNVDEGEAYSWYFTTDPDAADDCVFYLKNDSDADLILEGMDLFVTDDCDVYVKLGGSGAYATGTTAVVGANLNAGSGNVADCTCGKHTDIEAAGSTFSGGTEVARYAYQSGTLVDTHHINFPCDLIVPKNQIFTIWVDTISIVIQCTVWGYFHD
jgi:hypothetical protein